jgi:hypothetical protein
MPSEALSGGALNESTPAEQRVADKGLPLSDGPKLGVNDSRLPAKYERTVHGHTVIIEDR